jgi:hypothetical protein
VSSSERDFIVAGKKNLASEEASYKLFGGSEFI